MTGWSREEGGSALACRIAAAANLGKASGALRFMPHEISLYFSYLTIRRALNEALHLAGFTAIGSQLTAWLGGCEGPPSSQKASCSPQAVVSLVLSRLAEAGWAPLAEAARLTGTLAPHMLRGADAGPWLQEMQEAREAVDEARRLLEKLPVEQPDPLETLFDLLSTACESAMFAPAQGGEISLPTPQGLFVTRLSGHVTHHWALGVLVGEILWRRGYLSRPLPLASIVSAEMLRTDLGKTERKAAFYDRVRGALAGVQADISRAMTLCGTARNALRGRRSNSRSTDVYAAIGGLGALRRGQIMQGFGLSPRGVDIVLAPLKASGLIVQENRMSPFTASYHVPLAGNEGDQQAEHPILYAELDEALSGLDRLLTQFGDKE